MTKRVLVLCQRKRGKLFVGNNAKTGSPKYDTVEARIVPEINKLVADLFAKDYEIDYLSTLEGEHSDGEVDIQGYLSLYKGTLTIKGNEKISTRDFIKKNKYDLIILNTCPFSFMDYDIIYALLTADGLIALTAYPRKISIPFVPPAGLFTFHNKYENVIMIYKKNAQSVSRSAKRSASRTPSPPRKRTRKNSDHAMSPHKSGGYRKKTKTKTKIKIKIY